VAPEEFVSERNRVARELKDAGRDDDARAVAELKKPSAVVLAVNRAARDRSRAARDAVDAAERVRKAQLAGKPEEFERASDELEKALGLLAEVAVARLSRGKPATESMRRRVNDLLRAAMGGDESRDALVRGALAEELEASGFSSFAGLAVPQRRGRSTGRTKQPSRGDERRRARRKQLEEDLARAQHEFAAAQRRADDATRERDRAAKAVSALQEKLNRL
jgi:hypothetical protein